MSLILNAPSPREAIFVAGRFNEPPIIGPMATERSEVLARSIAELMVLDPRVTVRDGDSGRADYMPPESYSSVAIDTTTVSDGALMRILWAQEDAVKADMEKGRTTT